MSTTRASRTVWRSAVTSSMVKSSPGGAGSCPPRGSHSIAIVRAAGRWSCPRGLRAPEPARPAHRAELLLLGGERKRGVVARGGRRVAAQEVDLHLADEPAAKLGVADARALVRRRGLAAGDRGDDVVGD